MIAATICSGIGAPEVAMPHWSYAFQSEIEAFPREVLKARHGSQDVRYPRKAGPALWGDFTTIRVRHLRRLGIALPEWLIAGTPCQAFSVAGNRQSLSDDRGNLTLEFVRLAHSLRRAGSLKGFTWENVPGVLSTSDNAFGCFLAAVVGADAPLHSPLERGRWPGAGMVAGPRARLAWRVLDAQYFGLAQRRRRVFVVASFGDRPDPAEILFECIGLQGNTPPSREAGQAAPTIPSRGTAGGGLGTDFDCDGGLIASTGDISHCLNAGGMGRQDYETETLIAHSLRAEGFDASEDGTGRGTPLVPVGQNFVTYAIQERAVSENLENGPGGKGFQPDCAYTLEGRNKVQAVAFAQNSRDEVREIGGNIAGALAAEPGMKQTTYVAFTAKDYGADASDISPTLRSGSHDGSHANGGVMPAVAFDWQSGGDARGLNPKDSAQLQHSQVPALLQGSAVRRLTPLECSRLQGFPDGYLDITYRGNPAADGPKYKALGNSMAMPCLRWIGERIEASLAAETRVEAA